MKCKYCNLEIYKHGDVWRHKGQPNFQSCLLAGGLKKGYNTREIATPKYFELYLQEVEKL